MKILRILDLKVGYSNVLCIILLLLVVILPRINGFSYGVNENFILRTGIEAGGSSQPNLTAQCVHSPLWPQATQNVNITANALNGTVQTKLAVDSIEIFVNDNITSPVATIQNSSTLNHTFRASTDSPIISYSCRVADNGTSVFSGWRTVRIETRAIPIIYSDEPKISLDILFIPDKDTYSGPTDPKFLVDVEKAIQMYYNETIFLKNQDKINFWIAQDVGDARGECIVEPPGNWDSEYTFPEVGIVLHGDNSIRDCALLGAEELFTANMAVPARANITLLHETGHRPFGLADEYEGEGGYFVNNPFPNIFALDRLCKEDELGKERECRKIAGLGREFFTSDTTPEDLMADNLKIQMLDERRIQWWFDCLRKPSCYDVSHTGKSIVVRLNFSDMTVAEFLSSDISFGDAPTDHGNPPLVEVTAYDYSGNVVQDFNYWHPLWAFDMKEDGREALTILQNAEGRIVFPFDPDIVAMDVSYIYSEEGEAVEGEAVEGDHVISIDLRPSIRAFCEEFRDDPSCQVSDLAIIDVRTLEPQLSILTNGSAEVTVSTTAVNNGRDAPIDAILSSKATPSSSSGLRVTSVAESSQDGTKKMTLPLQSHHQHDQLYRIECLEPGTYNIVFENQIASLSAAVIEANKNNDKGNISFQIDCSLNPAAGPTSPSPPIECPTGQEPTDTNGTGIADVCVPIICPTGQTLEGNVCVPIICPTGQTLEGNVCVPIICPTGQTLEGNVCVPIICPTGQTLEGNVCVPIICPTGQTLEGNVCVSECDENEERVDGECVCIGGYERVDGECVPECDENEERVDGECVCIGGYERVDGECVPECDENEERVDGECVPECGDNEERVDGECVCESPCSRDGDICYCPTPELAYYNGYRPAFVPVCHVV